MSSPSVSQTLPTFQGDQHSEHYDNLYYLFGKGGKGGRSPADALTLTLSSLQLQWDDAISVCRQRTVLEELDKPLERHDNRRSCWRFPGWDVLVPSIEGT
ncbi:protein of unknown function [Candidatus Methylomirabilis oxygeniifera]|uniref:Uncharacterized protein n=1 Tax=Methylomirabilis oxygeniifera TaxID=671143 RepID=D5MMT5_METO1|nr:protein of unknown function [Candidatus Methylomirabilis oxyfera]